MCICIVYVGLGISLFYMSEIGELHGVPEKESCSVVSYHVKVTFFSVKFDGISSHISYNIRGSLLAYYSRKSQK